MGIKKQVGNFIVKEYGEKASRLKFESVSGTWSASWSMGTDMHAFGVNLLHEEKEELLEPLIVANYLVGNVMLDAEGLTALFQVYKDFAERQGVSLDDEEDEEIIKEMQRYHEAKEITDEAESEKTDDSTTEAG